MDILIININKLDKQSLKKEIKKINRQYKLEEKIQVNFLPDYVGIDSLMYLFDNLKMTKKEFDNKIVIEHPNKLEILNIAYEVYMNRHREEVRSYLRAGIISLLIIGLTIFGYYSFNYIKKNIYEPSYQKHLISQKIIFLISDYNLGSFLEANYKNYNNDNKTKESFKQDLVLLSDAIYKTQIKFDIPHNILIAMVKGESDFWKYAKSTILVKDKNGNIKRTDSAKGYGQIYLEVWGEVIGDDCLDIFEPAVNLYWSGYILKLYLKKNDNNLHKALFNYNGGRFIYTGDKKVISTEESFNHISKILNVLNRLSYYESLKI